MQSDSDTSKLVIDAIESTVRKAVKKEIAPELAAMQDNHQLMTKKYDQVLTKHEEILEKNSELNEALEQAQREVKSREKSENKAKQKEVDETNALKNRISDLCENISALKENSMLYIPGILGILFAIFAYVQSAPLGITIFVILGLIFLLSIAHRGPLGWLNKKYLRHKAEKLVLAEFSKPEVKKHDIRLNPDFPKCLPHHSVLHSDIGEGSAK